MTTETARSRRSREPRHSLEHSVKDGCAHAIMLGAGEAYVPAFAIFLGMGSLSLGLLSSLPLLVGSLMQMRVVTLLDRGRRPKPLVVRGSLSQAAMWLPILLLPKLFPELDAALLLLAYIAYQGLGSAVVPAWSSWMGQIVPRRLRGAYFGRREQLRMWLQAGTLVAAGATLALARGLDQEYLGFAVLFVTAMGARLVSAHHQQAMSPPPPHPPHDPTQAFTFLQFVRRTPHSNFARFSIYVALVMAATNMASPYFALFMLRDLGFSYLQFTASGIAVLLAQALTLQAWGRLGDRYGNRFLLKLTGVLVPLVPLPWLLSTRFEAILVWQLLGGMVWAGFNLCTLNFMFDAVSPAKRARCVAYYNVLVNGAILAGAVGGGLLAPHLPSELVLLGRQFHLESGLQLLFLISGALRLVLAAVFLPMIREVRPVPSVGKVLWRIAGLGAARGARIGVLADGNEDEAEVSTSNLRSSRQVP